MKKNIEKFRKYFDYFILLLFIFLFYLYLLTIFWNLGLRFDMRQVAAPALGVLFLCSGILIEKSKRNWFIGIRTPWTLSSDKVWKKTQDIGGKLFKVSGAVLFLGIILPNFLWILMGVSLGIATIYPIIFSYFEFQREVKNH